ncbi:MULTISPECIES: O-antigen ligase [unclassified Bradyrhizobium]|uniref:O-antigen ligase family protein n=1 Tax=unclassified Bradyrhizobium TaxID=2631580 RepID=UPI00143DC961|nr:MULTISPECIES: O-antigen ligase family protein [unclassified Bradyrhizobium]
MVLDVLFTIGLLLSTASQLRPAGAAVGPGEICLAIWVLLMLSREMGRLGPAPRPALSKLMIFWLVFAVALCVGTMAGFATGDRHDSGLFMHDVVAYVLLAAVSCLSVVEPGAGSRLHRVAWLLATLGTGWLSLQVAFGWEVVDPGDFDTWEWDRFRGLSDNANQLADFCLLIGFVSLHLAEVARGVGERIAAVICMIVAIVVGRLTKSDAFLLVLLAAGPIFFALKLLRWLMSLERQMALRSAFAWILVLSLPLAAAYATPLGAFVGVEDLIKGMTKGGGDHDTQETTRLRIEIWNAAMHRGIEAAMLGLGPGPHLEIPPTIVTSRRESLNDPKHVEHPEYGFTPNFEAHNTSLDLFIQGGLIAVLSLGWLVATALVVTHMAKLDALTTWLCGLAIFSIFHLIVRHPTFWFAIALCLVAAANARGARTIRVGS